MEQAHGCCGNIRTVLIFLDLPVHCEFRLDPIPILMEGMIIEFNELKINVPDSLKDKIVCGPYIIKRSKYVYASNRPSNRGLTQYLEMEPVDQ
ncbi:MAG TPA: hypothetical protein ENI76_03915 [Ignavibacteria bacterium]|nr:hypothetical protein [Ignavibacteria bacterium]